MPNDLTMAKLFEHRDIDRRPAEQIRQAQEELLRRHIAYIAEHSAFYRRRFQECGVDSASIHSIADLARLPLTEKAELDEFNSEFCCASQEDIVDICLTSGTTASPVPLLQTRLDLERVAYNEEMGFSAAGITSKDTVMVAAAMDRCFMAGLAYFMGLTRLGATALRAGSSSFPVVMELIKTHRPTAIVGVPTLMKTIGERLEQAGVPPRELGVERLICIGEPVRKQDFSLSSLGRRIHELWDAQVFGTYASTELATAFSDCEHGQGGHLRPDLIVLEIVDEDGVPLPPGQVGEVVATPLQVTGMPLLRFRTGDMAMLHAEPCACGRTTPRLAPILGRKKQVLKYRGTTVYPPAIFTVLQEMEGVQNYYIEVRDEFELSDHIRVVVGVQDESLSPALVAERIAARTRVKPEVEVKAAQDVAKIVFPPEKRKPVTFFDFRTKRD